MDNQNPKESKGDVNIASPFLLDQDVRCTNEICPIKSKCLRYLQFIKDKETNFDGINAEFFIAISSLEDYNYEDNCIKYIKLNEQ